jgi:hypothetical protein
MSTERKRPSAPASYAELAPGRVAIDCVAKIGAAPGAVRSRSGPEDGAFMIRPHSNGETTCTKRTAPRRWQATTGLWMLIGLMG